MQVYAMPYGTTTIITRHPFTPTQPTMLLSGIATQLLGNIPQPYGQLVAILYATAIVAFLDQHP
jgi:hypothetical protein